MCPISLALELLGDPWTLLIVRDLMFKGRHTFAQFLAGGEGIASNILSERLVRLENARIVTKRPDPTDARRFIYRLDDKGIALAPVLVELVLWSAEHERTAAPEAELHAMRRRGPFLRALQARLVADKEVGDLVTGARQVRRRSKSSRIASVGAKLSARSR
jgi:DNA-binding HxlR family transcriptional regulator